MPINVNTRTPIRISSSSSSHSQRGPSRRSSMMTASKGLSSEVGRCLLVSFRIWSIHLPRRRPGRRLQEGWGRRPSERLTWDCRALCAGVLSGSLAMWPKTAMRRCRMTSLMAGRPVSADISELRTNCLHEILRILRWHFIWNACRDLASAEVRVHVSEA